MFDYQDIEISVFRWMNPSPEEEVSQDNPVNS
jgi:hypothetical protein